MIDGVRYFKEEVAPLSVTKLFYRDNELLSRGIFIIVVILAGSSSMRGLSALISMPRQCGYEPPEVDRHE